MRHGKDSNPAPQWKIMSIRASICIRWARVVSLFAALALYRCFSWRVESDGTLYCYIRGHISAFY